MLVGETTSLRLKVPRHSEVARKPGAKSQEVTAPGQEIPQNKTPIKPQTKNKHMFFPQNIELLLLNNTCCSIVCLVTDQFICHSTIMR